MFVSKTSWRHLKDMSWTRLEDILKTSWRHVFKASSRHVFKTFSRRLQDEFRTFWKTKNCYAEDVMKTLQDMSWGRLQDVLKTNKCLLGNLKQWPETRDQTPKTGILYHMQGVPLKRNLIFLAFIIFFQFLLFIQNLAFRSNILRFSSSLAFNVSIFIFLKQCLYKFVILHEWRNYSSVV